MMILFSQHALFQMKERGLTKKQVIRVVQKPELDIRQGGDRYRALKRVRRNSKSMLLVVVYDRFGSSKEVVTAFLTSKLQKYL